MEAMNVIYGLKCSCHPAEGVRYVGQSSRGARVRFYHHSYAARVGKPWKVSRWMASHGVENISWVILEELESEDGLDAAESMWIEKMGTMHHLGGCNLWPGGSSVRGYKHAPDARTRTGRPHSDETREALRKASTGKFGESSGNSKLTESQVAQIRHDLWLGMTHQSVANKNDATLGMVATINRDSSWPNVAWPIGPRIKPPTGRYSAGDKGAAVLNESIVREIRRMRNDGHTYTSIGKRYGVTGANVSLICNRKTWADVE